MTSDATVMQENTLSVIKQMAGLGKGSKKDRFVDTAELTYEGLESPILLKASELPVIR